MSTFALVEDATGAVVNRIVLDDPEEWTCPEDHHLVEETGSHFEIGGTIVGDVFTPPTRPPSVPYVQEIITDVQFFTALAHAGNITQDEAIAAVATGTIPATILAAVNALPADQKFVAQMKISGQTTFARRSPIVAALGASLGWTSEQIDGLWRAAAAL